MREPTLIILGAGASVDLGFPTGIAVAGITVTGDYGDRITVTVY